MRRKATVENSLVPEPRLCELMVEAGFGEAEPFHRAQLLGGWLARKR